MPNPQTNDDIATVMALLRKHFTADMKLGARVKFIYKGGGTVMLDGTKNPADVHDRDEPADCISKLDIRDHLKILRGELNQQEAFRTGKLFLSGDVHAGVRYSMLLEHALKGERPGS